jgi:hypothetical protein
MVDIQATFSKAMDFTAVKPVVNMAVWEVLQVTKELDKDIRPAGMGVTKGLEATTMVTANNVADGAATTDINYWAKSSLHILW